MYFFIKEIWFCFCYPLISLPVHSHYLYGHMLAAFREWNMPKSGDTLKGWGTGKPPPLPCPQQHQSFLGHRAIEGARKMNFELWTRGTYRREFSPYHSFPSNPSSIVFVVVVLNWCTWPCSLSVLYSAPLGVPMAFYYIRLSPLWLCKILINVSVYMKIWKLCYYVFFMEIYIRLVYGDEYIIWILKSQLWLFPVG